jgi:hypothetical protein
LRQRREGRTLPVTVDSGKHYQAAALFARCAAVVDSRLCRITRQCLDKFPPAKCRSFTSVVVTGTPLSNR